MSRLRPCFLADMAASGHGTRHPGPLIRYRRGKAFGPGGTGVLEFARTKAHFYKSSWGDT